MAKLIIGLVSIAVYQAFVLSDGQDADKYRAACGDMIVSYMTPGKDEGSGNEAAAPVEVSKRGDEERVMASIDRFGDTEHAAARPARGANLAWLTEATTWFAMAIAGMVIVFIGLAVDAYRHNHSAAEESLLSLGNPGHLLAAIGLAITSVARAGGVERRGAEGRDDGGRTRSGGSCR